MTNDATDQDRIAAAQIVVCVGEPGTGKTFTGDYLDVTHRFSHVDGDSPIRNSHIPKNKKILVSIAEVFMLHEGKDGPAEKWQPYFQEIVDQTIEVAKKSDKVVVTFAVSRQKWRDFIMDRLREGGAKDPTLLYLAIDQDVKIEGLFHRTIRQCKGTGYTITDLMRAQGYRGKGEISISEYKEMFKEGKAGGLDLHFDGAPNYAVVVDVTSRDASSCDRVSTALGLKRSAGSYEEICQECLAIDCKRDEDTPYNYDHKEIGELMKKKWAMMEMEKLRAFFSFTLLVIKKLGQKLHSLLFESCFSTTNK